MSRRALMIDLETLGSGDRVHVPVLQVGVAVFEVEDGVASILDNGCFHIGLDGATQDPASPPIEKDTMDWWLKQPDEVRELVFFPRATTSSQKAESLVLNMHTEIGMHIRTGFAVSSIWANGVADFQWLTGLFNRYNLTPPWAYNMPRDYRTVRELAHQKNGGPIDPHPQIGLSHNAVDDAVWQCHMLAKYLHVLGLEL